MKSFRIKVKTWRLNIKYQRRRRVYNWSTQPRVDISHVVNANKCSRN